MGKQLKQKLILQLLLSYKRERSLQAITKKIKKVEAWVKKNKIYDPSDIAILGEKRAREKEEGEKE